MKQRIVFITELIGGIVACIGIGMFSPAASLITAGVLIVVACEANS